jgi:hypothetical protein
MRQDRQHTPLLLPRLLLLSRCRNRLLLRCPALLHALLLLLLFLRWGHFRRSAGCCRPCRPLC